ncbi:MAG: PA-phosphatase, partial [Thermomicrobiales bacterium]|nr:PA-phosphatase [Thermomicrobiales bacterium]
MEPTPHLHLAMTRSPVSRRTTLRGIGTAGIATALGLVTPHRTLAGQASAEAMIEPEAGSWKTWILESGDQLRPEAPPDETATQEELGKLRDMVADRDAVALDRISYWDAGSPGYRWNEIATQQTQRAQMGPNAYR